MAVASPFPITLSSLPAQKSISEKYSNFYNGKALLINNKACERNEWEDLLENIENMDQDSDELNRIIAYDIFFDLDPEKNLFHSTQDIKISHEVIHENGFSFYLGADIVIDQIRITDSSKKDLNIKRWGKIGDYSIEYYWGDIFFNEFEVEVEKQEIVSDTLNLRIDYHLPPEKFDERFAENLYDLSVSTSGVIAGGYESGAFPIIDNDLSSPFRMRIKHPEIFSCAVPGEFVDSYFNSSMKVDEFVSFKPYDPSFSCAPFTVFESNAEDISIETYFPENETFPDELLSLSSRIIGFYYENLGSPESNSFKIVFPPLKENVGGGESNGNLIMLADIKQFTENEPDQVMIDSFQSLIAHEGYHLWNTWSIDWEGDLYEWWTEGGATFMASWTSENLLGVENGIQNRLRYINDYSEEKIYLSEQTLSSFDSNLSDNWVLIYEYGALIWEQLRQQIGSEELIDGLRDFYTEHYNGRANLDDLVHCLERYSDKDVRKIIDQWTEVNAAIDLRINNVKIEKVNDKYKITVEVYIDGNQSFDIVSALGFRTESHNDWQLIDVHFQINGKHSVEFITKEIPTEIQIDPEYRIPQINIQDNIWK